MINSVTRRLRVYDWFGRVRHDLAQDSVKFGFTILSHRALTPEDADPDNYDLEFVMRGTAAQLDAFAEHYNHDESDNIEWEKD